MAAVLTSKSLTVTARAGTEGRLFGSVTAQDLADAVQAQLGASVDRRRIALDEPIKSVGVHTVPVHLFEGVQAELTVEVVAAG